VLRNLERLGELLIAVRIYLGLTQAELAERLGVDPSVVWRYGRPWVEAHGDLRWSLCDQGQESIVEHPTP
jgi:hypothetical protein